MRGTAGRSAAPQIVHSTVSAAGKPLDQPVRAHFESRFHQDFSRVRVHAGSDAARSAQAIDARAYTAGNHVVFGAHEYDPSTRNGHRLLAHEMNHVVQQHGARIDDSLALENDPATVAPLHREHASVMRADTDAVRQVKRLESVAGAGIHFFPSRIVDTKIGPVEAASPSLSVIIGEGLSPRILARELLPLWTTATPFTPPGGGPVVEPGTITEEQLAMALLSWNATYLGIPTMNKWRVGLRLPLPVNLDAAGIGTVNPDMIRSTAAAFDPMHADLLEHRAIANVTLPAPLVQEEARLFLAEQPTPLLRGMSLALRATTNALASSAMIAEVFKQLSPAAAFEVAIVTVEHLSPSNIELLATVRSGGAILDALGDALAKLQPVPQAFAARYALARPRLDAFPARFEEDPPAKVAARPEKTVTVDTVKVDGARLNPSTAVQVTNAIYAQCNVRFSHRVNATAPATFLGDDNRLQLMSSCKTHTKEERDLFDHAHQNLGFGARIQAYFVPAFKGIKDSALSYPPLCKAGKWLGTTFLSDTADNSTLAHEIGHILMNSSEHPKNTIMGSRPRPNEITDQQCKRIYDSA
jgi:hypothetical protein